MKPFDLEKALRGEKVVTRDGREVTQLTHFETQSAYRLHGVVSGRLYIWFGDGSFAMDLKENNHNLYLFMATKTKKISCRAYNHFTQGVVVTTNSKELLTSPHVKWVSDIFEVEVEDNA